ncbi:hypothetical protein GCM10022384_38150 [Streptomyces marokkonensis]|uniref:Copper resistance protein D domain-containing protein n=1 Tax=Streptomyces marokkonensis TaxID=324855 RepID=A0ABP7QQX4_9ACTN
MAVGLALTWAATEHAAAGIQVPVAMTSSVLHLLATAVRPGGLVALLLTLRGRPDAGTVARFSRIAFASVTVLVVSGVYQSWRGLDSWPALTGTTYGRLLLAKLAGVAVLLAAAAVSRRWTAAWVSAVPAEGMTGVGAPAVGVSAETAVRERVPEPVGGPLALVVTTVLTGTPPGRATAEAAARAVPGGGVLPAPVTTIPFDVGGSGRGTVQITLDPGRTGDNAVQAVVFGPDGSLAAVPELRLSFTLPDREVGPIGAELVDRGGYWSANSLTLPLSGAWTMKTTVRVSETDQVSGTRRIRIER